MTTVKVQTLKTYWSENNARNQLKVSPFPSVLILFFSIYLYELWKMLFFIADLLKLDRVEQIHMETANEGGVRAGVFVDEVSLFFKQKSKQIFKKKF